VCGIVEGRANLAATLKDTRTVVGKLERFMGVVIQAVFLFLYLLIWQVIDQTRTHATPMRNP